MVEEVAGNPGYYTSKFFLKPHYQLEGLSVSLRLTSKLPLRRRRSFGAATVSATLKLTELAKGSSRLADLLAEGQNSVRSDPANAKRRTMLFQLMVLSGQWDRALTQLYVIKEMDGEADDFVRTYREVVRCELFRKEVFAGGKTP